MVIYLTKNLVLLGMMGVGKTTIGKILSRKSGLKLIDVDKLIEKKEQISISNIFQSKGEGYFRRLEEITTIEILKKNYKKIIALGGGAFINPKIRKTVFNKSISFWLDEKLEKIEKRVSKSVRRPLINNNNSQGFIIKLFNERKKIYNLANFRIKCDKMTKIQIAEKILNIYEKNKNSK